MPTTKRNCAICGRTFRPNKFAWRQRVCSKKACQSERQRRNWAAWKEAHPEYFDADADPAWAAARRNAQAAWRRKHPDYNKKWREKNGKRRRDYMREYMREYMRRYRVGGSGSGTRAAMSGTVLVPTA